MTKFKKLDLFDCRVLTAVLYTCVLLSLQSNLYPTVGLQTPGEVVEANFGQTPFVFDIEDYMKVSV